MMEGDREFTLSARSKKIIRIFPVSWDRPELQGRQGSTKTREMLYLQFFNSSQWNPNSLAIALTLGPGDEYVRRQIYDAAMKTRSPFQPDPRGLSTKWPKLFWKEILPTADYDDLDFEGIQSRVQEEWSAFKSNELPLIKDLIDRVFL